MRISFSSESTDFGKGVKFRRIESDEFAFLTSDFSGLTAPMNTRYMQNRYVTVYARTANRIFIVYIQIGSRNHPMLRKKIKSI